jgi:hypothetical protein
MITGVAILVLGVAWAALTISAARPANAVPPPEEGRFRVTGGSGNTFVLHDSISGVAWVMSADPAAQSYAWLPTKRLNTPAEVQAWRLGGGEGR